MWSNVTDHIPSIISRITAGTLDVRALFRVHWSYYLGTRASYNKIRLTIVYIQISFAMGFFMVALGISILFLDVKKKIVVSDISDIGDIYKMMQRNSAKANPGQLIHILPLDPSNSYLYREE